MSAAPSAHEQSQPQQLDHRGSLHHFRVNFNLFSLQGIERPIYSSLQFTYPHLGSAGVVRTPPQWFQPASVTRIERGSVCYELAASNHKLESIFTLYPVKIDVLRRTHLENDIIGFASIDLLSTLQSKPHTYRCPITSKTFKTLVDYARHRDEISEKYDVGLVENLPPEDPEIIYVGDFYIGFTEYVSLGTSPSPSPIQENSTLSSAKLRVKIVIEDKGEISREKALKVRPGYRMHGGAVYDTSFNTSAINNDTAAQTSPKTNPLEREIPAPFPAADADAAAKSDLLSERERALIQAQSDWEQWRQNAEKEWRESLAEKEASIRNQAKQEAQAFIDVKLDDLKRTQQEVNRMEVRLKAAMDAVDQQKSKLQQQEQQLEIRAAQKIQELQLLAKRVKSEAKTVIDAEKLKCASLQHQLNNAQDYALSMEKKLKHIEEEYNSLKSASRNFPETLLREEIASLRARLNEASEQLEREKGSKATLALEREHFRAQMHRVANALKREREKSSAMARQEIEQLRLEFLAREER